MYLGFIFCFNFLTQSHICCLLVRNLAHWLMYLILFLPSNGMSLISFHHYFCVFLSSRLCWFNVVALHSLLFPCQSGSSLLFHCIKGYILFLLIHNQIHTAPLLFEIKITQNNYFSLQDASVPPCFSLLQWDETLELFPCPLLKMRPWKTFTVFLFNSLILLGWFNIFSFGLLLEFSLVVWPFYFQSPHLPVPFRFRRKGREQVCKQVSVFVIVSWPVHFPPTVRSLFCCICFLLL